MVGRAARLAALLTVAGCAPAPAPVSLPSLEIIRPFGGRHTGLDIRAPVGTPVLAAADGDVQLVLERPRAGRMVVLGHTADLATVYMHLSDISVRVGQTVRRGTPVGRSGSTGNATTPHLHLGVCRRPAGRCRTGRGGGWDDPAGHWVAGDACFDARRDYTDARHRLTYPLPCRASAGA
ncbi:MAG: M23 family metallopeptidase [Candidatus Rokuibacteriota bacterium]